MLTTLPGRCMPELMAAICLSLVFGHVIILLHDVLNPAGCKQVEQIMIACCLPQAAKWMRTELGIHICMDCSAAVPACQQLELLLMEHSHEA